MGIFLSQIYIRPGISFPFSHHFQMRISDEVSSLVSTSPDFERRFGVDWDVVIRMSAMDGTEANEIKGPTIFKKDKDVEYSEFLPFSVISRQTEPLHSALLFLFEGIYVALEKLNLPTQSVRERQSEIIQSILADPLMLKGAQ